MIGLNEAKSRLALRICGKLDHLAACNNFFITIYSFTLFCFYLFILAASNNLFFQDLYSFFIFLSVSVSILLLLLAQLIINLKIGESKVFANVFIDFVRILDEPIINQRVQLNT